MFGMNPAFSCPLVKALMNIRRQIRSREWEID
jgi:hypothetical protein